VGRPNLLIIMSDQHNPHVTGYAGDPWVRTPSLDALAASGVSCDRTYCAGPLCVPSRMSFMTGQYPNDLEIWTNAGVLPSQVPTFAHSLSLAGYETVLCGRMHFVGPDQNHGFQHRLVGDVSGAMSGSPGEMFEGVWSKHGCGQSYRSLLGDAVGAGAATYELYDADVTERTCRWLAERGSSGNETPFCMVVGMLLPHNPYVCSRDLFEEYMDRLGPEPSAEDEGEHAAVRALKAHRGADRITPEMARHARAAYYGLVTTLDRNVGLIVDALEASGLRENTVFAYTSDHGDLCGEHGLWWKDSFYEGSVGVPLLWSGVERVRPGARISAPVSLLDVAPTLTDFGEADPLPAARGHSLRQVLARGEAGNDWPGEAYSETHALGQRPARMVCSGRWKLNLYHGYDGVQLFDLEDDPGEVNDLGALPQYKTIRQELLAKVTAGWDGDRVEQRTRETTEGIVMTRRAQGVAGTRTSERWPFPVGQNRCEDA
jgi:choline-sulfatase